MAHTINIRIAHQHDAAKLTKLFNQYRQFYNQSSQLEQAERFISERLKKHDSTIFVAEAGGVKNNDLPQIIGFCQLYPCFSSISMKKAWILNDLYITPDFRKNGVGKKLIEQALEFCRNNQAAYVTLQTAHTNTAAQALYKKLGFEEEKQFLTFNYGF